MIHACACVLQAVRACPVPSGWENSNGSSACKLPVSVKQEADYFETGKTQLPAPPCTPVLGSCDLILIQPVPHWRHDLCILFVVYATVIHQLASDISNEIIGDIIAGRNMKLQV